MRSLLLSNWSSWHHAASATQWTEFERNTQSSTSPGKSCARLPAGLLPHRHLWCHCESTWRGYTAPREDGISKGTFMPSKPQSSKNLAFVGGLFSYYHLDGAKCKQELLTSKNLSMISITKVVISNEIINSPNCGVQGSHSPNEQDPRYNEDGFRAKYS